MTALTDADVRTRISFAGPRNGFTEIDPSGLTDFRWSQNFSSKKADVFLTEHQIQHLPEQAILDFMITCRNSLRIGGRLRVADTDWNNISDYYRLNAEKYSPTTRLTVLTLTRLLYSVGLAPIPIEFYDEIGCFHCEGNHEFDQFGLVTRSSLVDVRARDPIWAFSSLVVDGLKISNDRSMNGYKDQIHVTGDSHVRFLAGKDDTAGGEDSICRTYRGFCSGFIAYHVGPGLVFNLNKYGSTTRVREKIELLLRKDIIPVGCRVMFSFGEIDCRFHVCRHAEQKGASVESVVDELCLIYVELLDKVKALGYLPSVWAPFATTWLDHWGDAEHPIHGSYADRFRAISRFNKMMEMHCRERSFEFVSLLSDINDKNGDPVRSYFCDPLHLGQSARSLLHKKLADFSFQLL